MTDYTVSINFIDYAGAPVAVDLADASFEALAAVRDAATSQMAALDAEHADIA